MIYVISFIIVIRYSKHGFRFTREEDQTRDGMGEHWKMAVDQAKMLGFSLPANYKELTLEEQQKVASDFAKWEEHRQAQLEQQKQAFEDEERKWKELLDEAHATGYPQLPDNPSLLSSDERNAFAYEYNEWKGRIGQQAMVFLPLENSLSSLLPKRVKLSRPIRIGRKSVQLLWSSLCRKQALLDIRSLTVCNK